MIQVFSSDTSALIFYSIFSLWFLSEYIGAGMIPKVRRQGAKINRKDKGSALLIIISIIISITVSFLFAWYNIALLPSWTFYPGIVLMLLGIIVRQWSIFVLGRFFLGTVGTQEGQKVVKNGPYKLIRHPAYAGAILTLTGLGLALQSWGAVLITLLIFSLAYGYRIHIEENALILKLGNEYMNYMKRTKRIIPYIL